QGLSSIALAMGSGRFSVPAACVVFAIVGPVFAIVFARNGGFVGVFLSIVLVMLYYNAHVLE
ncbi:hypothetical protein, partial [Klebsiella variicola]|uniref:hypothetical protein n=1 Tax=Klebsiella variicola TaxID=244366 RepID=UPI001953F81C